MTPLQYRVLELSYKHKLSHIGSCLTALPSLEEIYTQRKSDEPVILSAGHAGLALYVCLEKFCGKNAEDLLSRHGVHPAKNEADGIYCSTGSLGQGLSVAVGRALSDRSRNVWVYITDGECAEGVIYESLCFANEQGLENLRVYCGWNGYGAYRRTRHGGAHSALHAIRPGFVKFDTASGGYDRYYVPFLKGVDAHYYIMTEADWAWVEANCKCPQCGGQGWWAKYSPNGDPPEQIQCDSCEGGRV